MKKNRFVKIAVCMAVLSLMTLCVVGTTFAKYTTGGSASDQARVAKWGVTVSMEADPLFKSEYAKNDTTYAGTLSVKSSSENTNVVAPGTDSSQAHGSAVFAITGTPEVAVRVNITLTPVSDVFLKASTYKDPTTAAADDTFTLTDDYYPVVFTLTQTKDRNGEINGGNGRILVSGTLAQIQTFLASYNGANGKDYEPNTNLASEYKLSWAWAIEGNNKADTVLGNLQAGLNPDNLETTAYNLNVAYTLSITVTQID